MYITNIQYIKADNLYEDANFLFQQDLPAYSPTTTTNWFADLT